MTALPLKKISNEYVRTLNTVLGQNREMGFSFRGQSHALCLRPSLPDYTPSVSLQFKKGNDTLWMGLKELPPISFFSEKLEEVSLTSLPQDIQSILLESLWEDILNMLESFFQEKISLESLNFDTPEDIQENPLYFQITSPLDGGDLCGHFSLSLETLNAIAQKIEELPLTPTGNFDGIVARGRLEVGRTALPQDDYKNIEPQDVLFFDNESLIKQNQYYLTFSPRLSMRVQYQNGQATLIEMTDNPFPEPENSFEEESLPEAASPEMGTPAEHLPVHVIFEVGEKHLPLKDVQTIQEGYTFELDTPIDRPVKIRANGSIVGEGSLVQVGERVGVQVTSFDSP
tara:strand:+ start:21016 stop:22044 length:1029 start_codon:yes stop_codon:yes gene_type:complete